MAVEVGWKAQMGERVGVKVGVPVGVTDAVEVRVKVLVAVEVGTKVAVEVLVEVVVEVADEVGVAVGAGTVAVMVEVVVEVMEEVEVFVGTGRVAVRVEVAVLVAWLGEEGPLLPEGQPGRNTKQRRIKVPVRKNRSIPRVPSVDEKCYLRRESIPREERMVEFDRKIREIGKPRLRAKGLTRK